jgi:hypothetical protein
MILRPQFIGLMVYFHRSIFEKTTGPLDCGLRSEKRRYLPSRSDSIVSSALAEEDLALCVVRLEEGPK